VNIFAAFFKMTTLCLLLIPLVVELETKWSGALNAVFHSFRDLVHGILSIKLLGALENLLGVLEEKAAALGAIVVFDTLLHLEVPLVHRGARFVEFSQ